MVGMTWKSYLIRHSDRVRDGAEEIPKHVIPTEGALAPKRRDPFLLLGNLASKVAPQETGPPNAVVLTHWI